MYRTLPKDFRNISHLHIPILVRDAPCVATVDTAARRVFVRAAALAWLDVDDVGAALGLGVGLQGRLPMLLVVITAAAAAAERGKRVCDRDDGRLPRRGAGRGASV